MRGTVAKRLRRAIFGEGSRRPLRQFIARTANPYTWLYDPHSPRSQYQALKAAHKEAR